MVAAMDIHDIDFIWMQCCNGTLDVFVLVVRSHSFAVKERQHCVPEL